MNRFRARYASRTDHQYPLILAHRGDSYRAPENTLEAAQLGFESGADGWELDVRLTADGQAVVIHDESLLRTTDVAERFPNDPRSHSGYPVSAFTLDEIRSLDAGRWFLVNHEEPRSAHGFGTLNQLDPAKINQYFSGFVRVPTLLEALQWTLDESWIVNVELKTTGVNRRLLVSTVLDSLKRTSAWDSVTISSFDHSAVEFVAREEPRVATGALIDRTLDHPTESWMSREGIDAVHGPPWAPSPDSGRPVLVYTVNDSAVSGLAVQLAKSGVSGLFTDDPKGLRKLFPLNRS